MPDAVTNIQDVQRPRKQGRRFGRRGGDSEGFHGRGHCRLGRRGSWTGEHSTQRTQAEQRLSRAWPGPAGESGVEGPACTQADGSRLALHRGPGAGQGARQGRNERPAEDPTEDCGGVQRRSEAARARGTGECTLAPGQVSCPSHGVSPHILLRHQLGQPARPTTGLHRGRSRTPPVCGSSDPGRACRGPPTAHVSPPVRDKSHGDEEDGAGKVDTEPR